MLSRRDLLALSAASTLPAWFDERFAWAFADEDPTRVFTGDKKPTDSRLGALKTLNDYFPFIVPKTKEAWETRRKQLREQLLVATGLWPMPEKTPLNPVVHGKIERDGVTTDKIVFVGYTVEKVSFRSMPGHTVCGNLYRPKPIGEPFDHPAVLFAHGHWAGGRFHDDGEKSAAASVKVGGEPDMDRGRYFMQALPATLARLGFVVFHYDMIGYADSTAIPHRDGFKDAEAELRLQSQMGLQTWNSIRALDLLSSLPGVDRTKIGMTGASGGGTQTFMLAAIDDRLASAFPAVMVSTGMQGGCVCENCSLLRVNTGNVEIAGLFAPRPQALSAANDWTKEMMTKGYPELQQLYELYGAKEKVRVRAWLEYGHQYNVHARQMMYSWFLKHLAGKDLEVKEPPFKPVPPKELSVFDDKHPRPTDELDAPKLRTAMTKASDDQMAKLAPKDAARLKEFKRVVGTALRVMVNSELPKAIAVRLGPLESKLDGITMHRAVLGRTNEKDAVPTCGTFGPRFTGDRAVIWLHPSGKASLFADGKRSSGLTALTDAGFAVVAPDLLGTGENALTKPFPVDKGFAGYTYGYNRSLLANRVHDALTLVAFGTSMLKAKTIHIVGWGEMGAVAVLAKALAGDAIAKTAADLNQFRFENVKDTADPMMLPGAVKYGGLPAFLALCAPGEVFVHNHRGTASGKLPRAAYEAAGAADNLTRATEKVDEMKIVEWLIK
jgi:dienelactone hydrolase/pimeloyl-ACP methyl ester carboxylesterase